MTIKARNCLELAEFIENEQHPWDIFDPLKCFFGQYHAMARSEPFRVQTYLGLNREGLGRLVAPYGYVENPSKFTRKKAVWVLRYLAEVGEVNWEKAHAQP